MWVGTGRGADGADGQDGRGGTARFAVAAVTSAVAIAAIVGGCGSSDDSGTSTSSTSAPASTAAATTGADTTGGETSASTLDGGGKELVFLSLPSSLPYVKDHVAAAKAEADRLGYKLTVVESSFDPAEQDQKVQQVLSTGNKPAAFLWWPADSKAGINSTRRLSQTAPVFQTNSTLLPEGEQYVKGYTGPNDTFVGQEEGKMLMDARAAAKDAGMKLHSANGNLLIINFPKGLQASGDRFNGLTDSTKSDPFTNVWNEPGAADAQTGYDLASQVIPKYKGQGIDFVLGGNSDVTTGVVKALKANGLTPGKDVIVLAGNFAAPCGAQIKQIEDGALYGGLFQSPMVDGSLVVREAAQYLATNEITPGEEQLEPSEEMPPAEAVPPHQFTFQPIPMVTKAEGLDTKLWGTTPREFCGS